MIDNYKDLPIGKMLRIGEIEKAGGDPVDIQARVLSVLDGRTPDEIMNLPLVEYADMAVRMQFLDEPLPAGDPKKIQKVGGFHLVPSFDMSRVTVAQFVDFQELCKRGELATIDILAAFYVPKGCVYGAGPDEAKGYEIDAVKRAIRDELSTPDAVAAYAFFLTKFARSLNHSLYYLTLKARLIRDKAKREKMLAAIREAVTRLSKSGDGSTR